MDFYVYDNVYTFNKRNPFSGSINNRLEIKSIDIPENSSFWFYTDMQYMQDNVNLQKRYVHIHPGVGTTNTTRFQKEPRQPSANLFAGGGHRSPGRGAARAQGLASAINQFHSRRCYDWTDHFWQNGLRS